MSYVYKSMDGTETENDFTQGRGVTPRPIQGRVGNYEYRRTSERDSGPYYFFSAGETVPVAEMAIGPAHIEACLVTPIMDVKPWVDKRYLENPTGDERASLDPMTDKADGFEEGQYTIHASHNRNTLLEAFGPGGPSECGIVEITAFARKAPQPIGLGQFNRRVFPVEIAPGRVPEEMRVEVAKAGGLAVRKGLVGEARGFFASKEFLKHADEELQRSYLKAVDEMMAGFEYFERFANAYLDKQDHAIKLPDSNERSKDTYDERDRLLQWLLGRQPIDTALTRALAGTQGGLTAEQLERVLTSVNKGGGLTAEVIATIAGQAASAAVLALQGAQEEGAETKGGTKRKNG